MEITDAIGNLFFGNRYCWMAAAERLYDERELSRLESSIVRGDCIAPPLQAGDEVFIDPTMRPEVGDVVAFRLSQRGADAQNTPPFPPDHRPRKAGDRWCKLYGVRHGLDFLYDRHGGEATATLMTCEDPDDTPALAPVRQVRRAASCCSAH